jgi:DNA-binding NtrC family response regulator
MRKKKDRSSYWYSRIAEFEKSLLESALDRHQWNRTKTAAHLGLSYRSILQKIAHYGLFSPEERARILRNADRFGVTGAQPMESAK